MPPKKNNLTDFFTPAPKKQKTTEVNEDDNKLVQLGKDNVEDDAKKTDDTQDDDADKKKTPSTTTKTTPTTMPTKTTTPKAKTINLPTTPVSYDKLEEGLPQKWRELLAPEFKKPYWQTLKDKLIAEEKAGKKIWPQKHEIFSAFHAIPDPADIKVFLIGQDPYPSPGVAMGLAFSAHRGTPVPQSLKNIYKELTTDLDGFATPDHPDLSYWATQGVFMLNTILTVVERTANAHKDFGWQSFTSAVISIIAKTQPKHMVWLCWGKPAQALCAKQKINPKENLILNHTHPSPLSANGRVPFFGTKPFSQINKYLAENNMSTIDWQLPK